MAQTSRSSALAYIASLVIVVIACVSARIYRDSSALQIAEANCAQTSDISCS